MNNCRSQIRTLKLMILMALKSNVQCSEEVHVKHNPHKTIKEEQNKYYQEGLFVILALIVYLVHHLHVSEMNNDINNK